jgi:hypothetical protein
MLIEITFCLHSLYYCSFTVAFHVDCSKLEFSFGQIARLIKNISYVKRISDFAVKLLTQHSFLLTGVSLRTPSRLSHNKVTIGTAAEAIPKDATGIYLQHGNAINAKATALCKGKLSYSRDDDVLTDSDLDLSDGNSDSDDDKSSIEDEHQRSSARKHSVWLPLDEQRLLAYKKEGKPESWIFRKFLGRTLGAVRTRCHMVQARILERHGNKNDQEGADVASEAKPNRRRGQPPKGK